MAMPDGRVRIYVKKQLRMDLLSFNAQNMVKLGTVAVGTVKERVRRVLDENDSRAKPLNVRYAIAKQKLTGSRFRDLSFSGNMLRNFNVRTVSTTGAYASNTLARERLKAQVNNDRRQRWIVFSASNAAKVTETARVILNEVASKIVKTIP